MDVDPSEMTETPAKKSSKEAPSPIDTSFKHTPEAAAELDAYVSLLVIVYLADKGDVEKVRASMCLCVMRQSEHV